MGKLVEDETRKKGHNFLSKFQEEWPSDETLEDLQLASYLTKKHKYR